MDPGTDDPDGLWTIGRLAAETGEEIRVVRFWAAHPAGPRSPYLGPDAMADVRFLRVAKQAGFSLDAIKHILWWPGDDWAAGVQLAAIRQQLARLQVLEHLILERLTLRPGQGERHTLERP